MIYDAGWGFVRGFFGRSKFDMADWGYSFPVDVLAICLIQYSGDVRGSWTRGMAYTALTIATGLGTLLRSDSLHSLCQFCESGCSGLSPCSVLRNVSLWEQYLQMWRTDVQLLWHYTKWEYGSACAATIAATAWQTHSRTDTCTCVDVALFAAHQACTDVRQIH